MNLLKDKQLQNNKHTSKINKAKNSYNAADIEILEGLEPVRIRPGMYIGGVDKGALHQLFSEVIDNAMDEVVAGYATEITVHLQSDNVLTITDDGRGIPVDPHPKQPKKSALEVILTTLHSGGKFSGKNYETSSGLHGVGISVVNALSQNLEVVVYRNNNQYTQTYSRGKPTSALECQKCNENKKGTKVTFIPDVEIFGDIKFNPALIYDLTCARSYLYKGVKIKWICDESIRPENQTTIYYPNGLRDFVSSLIKDTPVITEIFDGLVEFPDQYGKLEWAISWQTFEDGFSRYYCNTVYNISGGTHEAGFKYGLLKAIKNYGEMTNNSKISLITSEDILCSAALIVSIFIKNPIFQGQTKEKLLSVEAQKLVENAIKSSFENWLISSPTVANIIVEKILADCENRLKRKKIKEIARKNPIKSLRLPGKLVDCSGNSKQNSEIFLVEGESAGGSAKQARNRETQAILPLKGKILNVANSTYEKIFANSEIKDLLTALGCGIGDQYNAENLRYERVIIMTDADVDGAHITSLLLTFFYKQVPRLIESGNLYLAQPPLYKVVYRNITSYAANDEELKIIRKKLSDKANKLEISRFKGLGEMTASQLKETTMDPSKRVLLQVIIDNNKDLNARVNDLMGKNAEPRFKFIKERGIKNQDQISDFLHV